MKQIKNYDDFVNEAWKDEKLSPAEIAKTFKGRFGISANENPETIQKALLKLSILTESRNEDVVIDGKKVDTDSLEVDGINKKDYPKFSDAFFSKGTFEDGTRLTDTQLEKLTDNYDLLLSHIMDVIADEEEYRK